MNVFQTKAISHWRFCIPDLAWTLRSGINTKWKCLSCTFFFYLFSIYFYLFWHCFPLFNMLTVYLTVIAGKSFFFQELIKDSNSKSISPEIFTHFPSSPLSFTQLKVCYASSLWIFLYDCIYASFILFNFFLNRYFENQCLEGPDSIFIHSQGRSLYSDLFLIPL